jgi:hypothetical protein
MARTALINPIPFTLVYASLVTGGKRSMVTAIDPGYQIDVDRQGLSLNSGQTYLQTVVLPGPVGGNGGKTFTRPPQTGIVPSDVLEPMDLLYTYDETPADGNGHLVGQHNYSVKEYIPLVMAGTGDASSTTSLLSPRIMSFKGRMYMVGERRAEGSKGVSAHAVLYRRDDAQTMQLVRRFDDEPISTRNFSNEIGSPSLCVHGGRLYLSYRSVEASTNSNVLLVWRSDELGLTFEKIVSIELPNHPDPQGNYSSYRLRLASSGDTMMLVSYGVCPVTRDGTINLYRVRDARVYVSYNDGFLFESASKDHRPFLVEDQDTIYAKRSDANFSAMFFMSTDGLDEDDFLRSTVNFDLYFDQIMGQFVILKGGDPTFLIGDADLPPDSSGNNRLIGICASPEDPNTWAPCIVQNLDAETMGYQVSSDPFERPTVTNPGETDRDYNFWIYDLAVCTNGTESFLMMTGQSTNRGGERSSESVFTRFQMTPVQQLPKGFHDKILSYGTAVHPDFSFVCDAFDASQSGVYHAGDYRAAEPLLNVEDPCLTMQDHEVWGIVRFADADFGIFEDQVPCFVVHGAQSPLGEEHGYELSWTHYAADPAFAGFNVGTSGPVVEGLTVDGYGFATTGGGGNGYFELTSSLLSVADRIVLNRDDVFPFKSRFKLSAETPTSLVELWQLYLLGAAGGLSLRIHLDSARDLVFKDSVGATLSSTGSFAVPEGYVEFLVYNGYGRLSNGSLTYGAWVFVRAETGDVWTGPWIVDTISSSTPAFTGFSIGLVSYDVLGSGHAVSVKDVRLSSLGQGYRPYMRSFELSDALEEPLGQILDETRYPSRPLKVYGNKVDLPQGVGLSFYGGILFSTSVGAFSYDRVGANNVADNLMIPVANRAHDVTSLYDSVAQPLYVFENTRRQTFNSVGFGNIVGATRFYLAAGTFDTTTETFTTVEASQMFSAPFMPLIITEQDGAILTIEQLPVETHRLMNQYAYVYNTDTGAFRTPQYRVVDNFDDVVVLDAAPTLGANETIALTYHSFTFSVPEAIGQSRASHIGLILEAPGDTDLLLVSLGSFVIGDMLELTQTSMGLSEAIDSTSKVVVSSNNFSHSRSTSDKPLQHRTSFDFYLSTTGIHRTLSALADLKQRSVYTALVYQDSEQDFTSFGQLTALDVSSIAYDKTGNLAFTSQDYLLGRMPLEPDEAYIELSIPSEVFEAGVSYTLSVNVITTNSFTVTWDLGDGTTDTGASISNVWASAGRYRVVASIDFGADNVETRERLITVTP